MKVVINLLVLILMGGDAQGCSKQPKVNLGIPGLLSLNTCANLLTPPGFCFASPSTKTMKIDCPRGVEPKETAKIGKSSKEIAALQKYPSKIHKVKSKGYTIRLVRIKAKKGKCKSLACCLIIHGLLQGDHDWFTGFGNTSLPFQLNDQKCDTWVVSLRGTVGSDEYDKSVTGKDKYDFTLDDMAIDDMPVIVNYIMKTAKCAKLNLFGISMGGAIITAFLAQYPNYQKKICSANLMSPAIFLGGMTNPIVNALTCAIRDDGILRKTNDILLNQATSTPIWVLLDYIGTNCVNNKLNLAPCGFALNALFGTPDHRLDITSENNLVLAFSIKQLPNWITVKTLMQLLDFRVTNKFCKYKVNPNAKCDEYKWANIDTKKTAMNVYYANCDSLVPPQSYTDLEKAVPGVQSYFVENMNHGDHTYSIGLDCYYKQMISNVAGCICSKG